MTNRSIGVTSVVSTDAGHAIHLIPQFHALPKAEFQQPRIDQLIALQGRNLLTPSLGQTSIVVSAVGVKQQTRNKY